MSLESRIEFQAKYENELKQKRKSEMLSIFKKALTVISKVTLKCTDVNMGTHFRINTPQPTFDFYFTIFDANGQNVTFTFYDFYDLEAIKAGVDQVVKLIKLDDFKSVEPLGRTFFRNGQL